MKKNSSWKSYLLEFLSVFFAVIFAFALNNWNENQKDKNSEEKILTEISNGLKKDLVDLQANLTGHQYGIQTCDYWRNVIHNKPYNADSLLFRFMTLTRDYISLQNRSGYEALKSNGLEIITNDSLRFNIISLYEYDFWLAYKLEEEYSENQFHQSYFNDINRILSPYLIFDEAGKLSGIESPVKLNTTDDKFLQTILVKIEENRKYFLRLYAGVTLKTQKLIEDIDKELKNN